jgi:hypothetical protein
MGPQKLDVGVMRRMGDRSDFIFGALLVAVLLLSGSLWLALLLACAHRTLKSNHAIRRELYPDIVEIGR